MILDTQKKLLVKNTLSSLIFRFITILSGFIIPRLVMGAYGSEVNGLISSIQQFLGIISLLELGVGAVVQSSLYRPIAEQDNVKINQILTSANKFFSKIGIALFVYVLFLIVLFPLIINDNFSWLYTAVLIISISLSLFSQYFFGIVDRLFLNSNQRGYVQNYVQIITLILNVIISFILIKANCSIQVFQFSSSVIFLLRPIFLRFYVKKHYNVNKHTEYNVEPIAQKWNGIAQHVAAVVLNDTDVIVLTCFSTLSNVSIYSVYYLVVNGVKQMCVSLTNGVQALEGNLWAKENYKELKDFYSLTEWAIHVMTIFAFSCTLVLIVPFVLIYTNGIFDVNYNQPLFGFLLTLAFSFVCFRLPYAIMILAANHFKQTQRVYIIAALLNLSVSIIMVFNYGLIGVAIGTIVALAYQTIWMAIYCSKHLIKGSHKNTIKIFIVDVLCLLLVVLATFKLPLNPSNFIEFIFTGFIVVIIVAAIIMIINLIFYKKYVKILFSKIFKIKKNISKEEIK